jgi:hypothetical protein
LNNRNMYCPPHGVHVPPVQRRSARPRGAMPQCARPQVVRPRGIFGFYSPSAVPGRVLVRIEMIIDPVAVFLAFTLLADHFFHVMIAFHLANHVFPFVMIALLLGQGWVVFQLTLFLSKWANTSMLHNLLTPVLSH